MKPKFSVSDLNLFYGNFQALHQINIEIPSNQVTALIGPSGCGKSTFLRTLNRMNDLVDTAKITGEIQLDGENIYSDIDVMKLRTRVGMVFQNPDNQIVASIVEEDVAFGVENLGIPSAEIRARVDEALKTVGMYEFREKAPHKLSGGQKQRVAVAGIIAMKPQCIVLDEPTAMLDPSGRKEVIETVKKLNREENITIVLITHYMDEAVEADRVIVVDSGEIKMDDTPENVFARVDEVKALGLDVPQSTELIYRLGLETDKTILNADACVEFIKRSLED